MRDLAQVYQSALLFASLRARADDELLPRMNELGAALRRRLRAGGLEPAELAAAADELHALTDHWEQALEGIRASIDYRTAVAAFEHDDPAVLRAVLPRVFAGLQTLAPPEGQLYYAIPVAAPRRQRSITQPFLAPHDCAERITGLRAGIEPEAGGVRWWDRQLRSLVLTDDPSALDSPIALSLDLHGRSLALFQAEGEAVFRAYTPRLRAPFSVVMAQSAGSGWEAFGDAYPPFRDRLAALLSAGGVEVQFVP